MPRSANKVAGILLLLVLICVGTTLLEPAFVTPFNVQNIVRYSALYGFIGIGVALVIITGGIDLSIGSVIGLVGCLLPLFLVEWGWSIPLSLSAVIAVALLIGLAHGLLITKMRLQPFIVTLCGLLIYRGLARWITADQTMGFGSTYDDSLRLLAIGKPCSVAFLLLVAGVGLAAVGGFRMRESRASQLAQDAVVLVPILGMFAADWLQSRSLLRADLAVFGLYYLWRERGHTPEEEHLAQPFPARELAHVLVVIGLLFTCIGGSRYLHGYAIERGETPISIGPLTIPTWSTRVAPRGVEHPQELMQLSGWFVIPGLIWLAIVLLRGRPSTKAGDERPHADSVLLPLIAMAAAGTSVWLARRTADYLMGPFDTGEHVYLPGGEAWIKTWRISLVFASLAALMASLAWFAQRAIRRAGPRALPPLLLTSTAAILWLLGQTPLGQTLVPAPFLFLLGLAAVAGVFLNQTIYGRYLLALGNNEEAARFSGIQTDRMILLAYVLCSLIAALGGILFALDTNTIQPQSHGNFYELYAIAAAVLGGCSLRGGEGTILGVVIGAAVMRVLYNAINLLRIPSQLEFAIIGGVILLGVLADEIVKRVMARRK